MSPDTATCADCLRELGDPADRRFGYPFINCTNCGPRFTIVRDVPYDRPLTTMASFAMCGPCAAEYARPRRPPVPRPADVLPGVRPAAAAGLTRTARTCPVSRSPPRPRCCRGGAVLAVKGLGGYHLAVDAASEPAAAALRGRKHREDKPFAVHGGRPGRGPRAVRR